MRLNAASFITFPIIRVVHIVHRHGSNVFHLYVLGILGEFVLCRSFLNTSIDHWVDVLWTTSEGLIFALLRKYQGLLHPVFVKLTGLSRWVLVAYDALKARLFQYQRRIIITRITGLMGLAGAEFAHLNASRVNNFLDWFSIVIFR